MHRLARHDDSMRLISQDDAGRAECLVAEQAVCIIEYDPHPQGASLLVDGRADPGDGACRLGRVVVGVTPLGLCQRDVPGVLGTHVRSSHNCRGSETVYSTFVAFTTSPATTSADTTIPASGARTGI